MEEDEVGLDANAAQFKNQAVEVLEVGGIEGGVVVGFAVARERIHGRLFAIVLIPLGEEAHAELVERGRGESLDGLALGFFGLEGPRVAGGAALDEGCAVRIAKVEAVADGDGAAVGVLRRDALERSGFAVEGGGVAGGGPGPGAEFVGHEADFVGAIAVVEAVDGDSTMLEAEGGGEGHVDEWIAGGGSGEVEFDVIPADDGLAAALCGLRESGVGEGGGGGCSNSVGRELEHVATIHLVPL